MLTDQDLIDNARKAYDEKRLVAQMPNPTHLDCNRLLSKDRTHCCALGTSLTPEYFDKYAARAGLPTALYDNSGSNGEGAYSQLMRTHDIWSNSRLSDLRAIVGLRRGYENDFRAVIGLEPLPC
jgi:hypothetical protein